MNYKMSEPGMELGVISSNFDLVQGGDKKTDNWGSSGRILGCELKVAETLQMGPGASSGLANSIGDPSQSELESLFKRDNGEEGEPSGYEFVEDSAHRSGAKKLMCRLIVDFATEGIKLVSSC